MKYEFWRCYSLALEEFINFSNESDIENDSIPARNNSKQLDDFLVNGKWLSKEEIFELANKPFSEDQININEERKIFSQKLNDQFQKHEFKVEFIYCYYFINY